MELKRDEIIKALECCRTDSEMDCIDCNYRNKGNDLYGGCINTLLVDALSLINELTEENERLRDTLKSYRTYNKAIKSERADTVRKMQEIINERLDISVEGYSSEEIKSDVRDMVDRIAEEMIGGADDKKD